MNELCAASLGGRRCKKRRPAVSSSTVGVSSSPRAGIEGSGGGLGDRDGPGPKISNCTPARCLRAHSAGGYGVYSMPRDPHSAASSEHCQRLTSKTVAGCAALHGELFVRRLLYYIVCVHCTCSTFSLRGLKLEVIAQPLRATIATGEVRRDALASFISNVKSLVAALSPGMPKPQRPSALTGQHYVPHRGYTFIVSTTLEGTGSRVNSSPSRLLSRAFFPKKYSGSAPYVQRLVVWLLARRLRYASRTKLLGHGHSREHLTALTCKHELRDLCRERCDGRLSLTRYILAALMKINAKQSNSLTTAAAVSKPAIQLPSASTMTALHTMTTLYTMTA